MRNFPATLCTEILAVIAWPSPNRSRTRRVMNVVLELETKCRPTPCSTSREKYRVLLLARERARHRKRLYGQSAEQVSLLPDAAVSAWPLHQPGRMDLLLQARMGIQPPSILPLASAAGRSPARRAIPTALHSVPTR